MYLQELRGLASEDSGWHFKASCTSTKQLEDFNLREMAQKMEISAPKWWSLLGTILMHGSNQKANVLQSLLGLFLQSVHTPYKVIDTLAHLGITISADTINMAIQALSAESQNSLRRLGQSLLASYAYDNFDVDLKSYVPTAEKSNDSLKHLTSGLLFPLAHGVTLDDLKCSRELWGKSALNPQFKSVIPSPEYIEQIPLVKTPIFAARAMDVNNSTVSGNIEAVNALLRQGGIEDPAVMLEANYSSDVDLLDASQYVILIHGDLGTGEQLQAAQLRRSIESTAWNCLQHVVFIPGLFHLKMACADVLWRCFIQPSAAREDETSLMCDIAQLRPKETGIYSTKLGFRRMHQLIGHAGTCRRLDCWRVHAETTRGFDNLESFALSKPKLDDLKRMADEVACTYVARHKLQRMHREQDNKRDLQFENALLLNKYFLLYEELSYAMNHGDIGRTETCIMSWIPILKATGKHKYATHMTNFLFNIHCVYPPGLRCAIRYHILINPTGHPAKWRAVDWCIELNNLFTKVKNGGKGSNRLVERIITESPLVEVYRGLQASVQQNFGHTHLATNHSPPDMRKTYAKVQERLALNSPHKMLPGRKSRYQVDDLGDKGREMMDKAVRGVTLVENDTDGIEEKSAADDIIVELI
ncbi:hypothetical protein EDD16DRAFT_1692910 [Pisolithus croceorrhizus]|nr:hypothetical protein EDD16DRAFT_1692910 [Pisolithus croceorrhizus]